MNPIKPLCTLGELRRLEVINVCDGNRLGCVVDIEFDLCLGNITAILIPKKFDLHDFFAKPEKRLCRIPWCCIERIGRDIILVRISGHEHD